MPRAPQSLSSSLPSTSTLNSSPEVHPPPSLHSPPSQFVGTPFTTPSSAGNPFEYPFPKDSQSNSMASSTGSSPGSVPIAHPHRAGPPASEQNASGSSYGRPNMTRGNRVTVPVPIPGASDIERALQMGLGLRSSSVPVPPSLIEKARRRGAIPFD